jgi:hypothetical protein
MNCWTGRGVSIKYYYPGQHGDDRYDEDEAVTVCADCGRIIYRNPATEFGWSHSSIRWGGIQ